MLTLDGLVRSLDLQPVGPDRYQVDDPGTTNTSGVLFGGQLMAQSVVAALQGQDGKRIKTVHTVFARSGSPDVPVEIAVDRMHAGRAFASSTVTISQGDRLCTRSLVLLAAEDDDLIRHADPAPTVALPDEDAVADGHIAGWDIQLVGDVDLDDPQAVGPPELDVWSRFAGIPDDPVIHQALLAYASDGFLIGTAMRPHAGVGQSQAHVTVRTGVVSHTLTYHEPFSAAEWLLLSHRSPYAGRGCSYGRADVFRGDGTLVASYVQDGLIRSMGPTDRSGSDDG